MCALKYDDCQLIANSGRRTLRSAGQSVCIVPRCNSNFGDRSFTVAAGWNYLPAGCCSSTVLHFTSPNRKGYDTFCRHHKRVLFSTSWRICDKCCYRLLEHASHNSNICLCLCPVVCTVWLRDVATAAADADARTQRNPYSSASSACHLLYGYRRCWPRHAMRQNKVSIQRFLSAFTSFY